MEDIEPVRMQELALRSVVARRCRRAYLHDIRGGIQPIVSSFELLSRAANAAPFNQALAGKASEFFRRALDAHERVVEDTLADICGQAAERTPVELEAFTAQALKFLQNDAAALQVSLQPAAMESAVVQICGGNLRVLLLALLTHAVDLAEAGESIHVGVERLPRAAVVLVAPRFTSNGAGFSLIREVGTRMMSADGGSMTVSDGIPERVTLSW